MHSFQLLLFLHILAVAIWLGGAIVGVLIGNRLRKAGDAAPFAKFCAAFAEVAGPAFGGSALLVLLTGIGMVAQSGGAEFSDTWISIGFAGWLVSTVLGATIVGRTWYRIGTGLEADGATLASVQPLVRTALTWTWVDLLLRTAIVLVMVWKPT